MTGGGTLLVTVTKDDVDSLEPRGLVRYITGHVNDEPIQFWVDEALSKQITMTMIGLRKIEIEIPLGHIDGAV